MSAKDYDKLDLHDHVIERPDMYIGDIEITTGERWIYDNEKGQIVKSTVTYNPGLEQCIMELLTNATDRAQDEFNNVTRIDIDIDNESISIRNDGKSIPIEVHETGVYVPELIFGHLLTSSNYKKDVKRTVGGKNGIGAKAANIFSKRFEVSVQNKNKLYTQKFEERMKKIHRPKIVSKKTKSFVKIQYEPYLPAFGMKSLHENDTIKIIEKRIIDASAVTNSKVVVYYNGNQVMIKDFQNYMDLYIGSKSDAKRVYVDATERWSVGFALNPYPFAVQISFVNGICTENGGTHVKYVLDPVVKKITEQLQEKNKNLTIRPQYVRDNIIVFVKCLIENPTFDSQTKQLHTTKVQKFGSKMSITDTMIQKIVKLGITENITQIAKAKELKSLTKTDGKKRARLSGLPKLSDAIFAGTDKSKDCTLILTEGDSAKATAMSGLAVVGNEYFGVFPLKGKLLNVRCVSIRKVKDNEELCSINKILGLVHGEMDTNNLRYGKIMLLTDADVDGQHIKGLLINYLGYFWPKIIRTNFITCLITPIVKVSGRSRVLEFYNETEYKSWKEENQSILKRVKIKYYKGLGTSTAKEAKEYFRNLNTNLIKYSFDEERESVDTKSIELAFSDSKKKNTDKRKDWISKSIEHIHEKNERKEPLIDYTKKTFNVHEFIHNELVQYSIYDNHRSIPHLMDGLKPSQRKIIYACLKKNLFKSEMKVAQLSGYVSEQTSYHHGETSLQQAIIGMAQNFVGSNNLNLLHPNGQFGSRFSGGKDSASARYIFTYLEPYVKNLFHEHDTPLLDFLEDDGFPIEPRFYVPTLPLLLINGADGIGTGWSTTIPCFNPEDIKENLLILLRKSGEELKKMDPWYRGFKGKIIRISDNQWKSIGIYDITYKGQFGMIEITELPVQVWVDDYKIFLTKLEDEDLITHYDDLCNDERILFKIKVKKSQLKRLEADKKIEKTFKLEKSIRTSNLHCFSYDGVIKKYECVEDILRDYFDYRLDYYRRRKKNLEDKISKEIDFYSEKMRFIEYVIEEKIKIFRMPKAEIYTQLDHYEFLNKDKLIEMKIHEFTKEKIDEMRKKINQLILSEKKIKEKTMEQFWEEDLFSM